jgi:thiazole biosynthesis enzyme
MALDDVLISSAILERYYAKLCGCLWSDVLIVGAGPSGLTAGRLLAKAGLRTTVVETKLAPGGGVWGGGMAMNEVVIQCSAAHLVEAVSGRRAPLRASLEAPHGVTANAAGLLTVDAVELASALILEALRAGVTILNLVTMEDVRVQAGRVTGLVVNATAVSHLKLHVDPITLGARAVIDGTGHDAGVAGALERHGLSLSTAGGRLVGEGPMDADLAEAFVVEHTGPVYPGLYLAGMSVCAALGGPRMGPIFGGMLLSGEKVARLVAADLGVTL